MKKYKILIIVILSILTTAFAIFFFIETGSKSKKSKEIKDGARKISDKKSIVMTNDYFTRGKFEMESF